MVDREKVIKALENCTAATKCRDCQWEACEEADCRHSEYPDGLIEAALELLKGQEPVRCKDCGYFAPNNAEEGDWSGRCTNAYVPMNGTTVDGWWFCGDGRRREDAADRR